MTNVPPGWLPLTEAQQASLRRYLTNPRRHLPAAQRALLFSVYLLGMRPTRPDWTTTYDA